MTIAEKGCATELPKLSVQKIMKMYACRVPQKDTNKHKKDNNVLCFATLPVGQSQIKPIELGPTLTFQ